MSPLLSRLTVVLLTASLFASSGAASEDSAATPQANTDQQRVKELDALLLGAWSEIEGGAKAKLSPQTLIAAVKACTRPVRIERLNIQPNAEKALPQPTQLVGTITYYRTQKGLQRLEAGNGTVLLLEKTAKEKSGAGRTFWHLSGRGIDIRLVFATRKAQKRDLVLMFEENRLFFRCPRPTKIEGSEAGE